MGEVAKVIAGVCLLGSHYLNQLVGYPVVYRKAGKKVQTSRDILLPLITDTAIPALPLSPMLSPVPNDIPLNPDVTVRRPRFSLRPEGSVHVTYETIPITPRMSSSTTIEELPADWEPELPPRTTATSILSTRNSLTVSSHVLPQRPEPRTTETLRDFLPTPSPPRLPRCRPPRGSSNSETVRG